MYPHHPTSLMVQTRIKRMFDDEPLCLMVIFRCLMAIIPFLPNHCAIACSCGDVCSGGIGSMGAPPHQFMNKSAKWAMKIPKIVIQGLEVSKKSWRVSPNDPKSDHLSIKTYGFHLFPYIYMYICVIFHSKPSILKYPH